MASVQHARELPENGFEHSGVFPEAGISPLPACRGGLTAGSQPGLPALSTGHRGPDRPHHPLTGELPLREEDNE